MSHGAMAGGHQWPLETGLHRVPASELHRHIVPGDWMQGADDAGNWLRKQRRAIASGMAEHIDEHGVEEPLTVWSDEGGTYLENGHHRLASALMSTDPDMEVPVLVNPDSTHRWLHHLEDSQGRTLPSANGDNRGTPAAGPARRRVTLRDHWERMLGPVGA